MTVVLSAIENAQQAPAASMAPSKGSLESGDPSHGLRQIYGFQRIRLWLMHAKSFISIYFKAKNCMSAEVTLLQFVGSE